MGVKKKKSLFLALLRDPRSEALLTIYPVVRRGRGLTCRDQEERETDMTASEDGWVGVFGFESIEGDMIGEGTHPG